MKRSEMVAEIKNKILEVGLDKWLGSDERTVEEVADVILAMQEERGMKPPICRCVLVPDTYHGGTKHGPRVNQWDPEDL